ncbi:MAG: hypothetical protein JSR82_06025 [Verrucomicrobia bacterium]|nr:hypothetical protein [Verrucomicrobiota bacterium]
MKPLLIAFMLAATLIPATEAAAREPNRKAKVRSCEAPKCCLHSRVPRVRAGVRAESAPRPTPAPAEQTWQERMASKGSGG